MAVDKLHNRLRHQAKADKRQQCRLQVNDVTIFIVLAEEVRGHTFIIAEEVFLEKRKTPRSREYITDEGLILLPPEVVALRLEARNRLAKVEVSVLATVRDLAVDLVVRAELEQRQDLRTGHRTAPTVPAQRTGKVVAGRVAVGKGEEQHKAIHTVDDSLRAELGLEAGVQLMCPHFCLASGTISARADVRVVPSSNSDCHDTTASPPNGIWDVKEQCIL